jgi:uncharacterized protein YjiK
VSSSFHKIGVQQTNALFWGATEIGLISLILLPFAIRTGSQHDRVLARTPANRWGTPADFEGIAVLGDTVWLMTSDGLLFAAEEAPDERSVRYRRFDTGHGDYCELEGLAQDPAAGTLILICKEANKKKNDLMMFEWSATVDGIEHVRSTVIPESSIEDGIDEKKFSPSGITIDPQTGERVIVAARQDALVRLEADGSLLEAIILKKKGRHKQAEGIELTRDGRMLIADEGGDGRARLAVYAATSTGNNKNE